MCGVQARQNENDSSGKTYQFLAAFDGAPEFTGLDSIPCFRLWRALAWAQVTNLNGLNPLHSQVGVWTVSGNQVRHASSETNSI